MATDHIAILGAGAWGTTLAWLWAGSGRKVTLWTRSSQQAKLLRANRKMEKPHLVELPVSVEISDDLASGLKHATIIVIAVNSQSVRELVCLAKPHIKHAQCVVSAAKGLELSTLKTMSQVIGECVQNCRVAVLSGPNLSAEIARKAPAASVLACADQPCGAQLQQALSTSRFRIYFSDDVSGVELGGALKNIIAIAAGCGDGLELGANARAAIMTRGLAEMSRLAIALGAQPTTLSGLSGMGDLIATCTSKLSRNYRLGAQVAQGMGLKEALDRLGGVAEGVPTCEAACRLSDKLGIDLPLTRQIEAVLKTKITPREAIMNLMSRPLIKE